MASKQDSFFVEEADFMAAVHGLVDVETATDAYPIVEWVSEVLEKYQEQSHLLDPYLEQMIAPVMAKIRVMVRVVYEDAMRTPEVDFTSQLMPNNALLHQLCRYIYLLCKTRKYKNIVKFFPHEVADVEPTLHSLARQDSGDHSTWETRYVLLMWMSILVLIPFNLATVDSGVVSQDPSKTLVGRIAAMCRFYLSDPGAVRDAGAICLAKLLSRPDMDDGELQRFFAWATHTVQEKATASASSAAFALTGVLTALVEVAKHGHREVLADHLGDVLQAVLAAVHTVPRDPSAATAAGALSGGTAAVNRLTSSTLVRKLIVKLASRTGLALLPPRVAPWRYQRGQRNLLSNLASVGVAGAPAAGGASTVAGDSAVLEDDAVDVPLDIEDIVDMLLTGLRDSDTVVRWSAAKGVGRITARLPWELGDEVVGAVLALLVPAETDGAWHGACLATAELARRGLLLPERLGSTVPLVLRALCYDVRRGAHSVGTHVRDAACYVAWAFARAYAPAVMAPHVMPLARGMLTAACYDREVNCRRAASAAFQENVGRQGHENFKHGIEILTSADYFTLGNRANAFVHVAPAVAVFPEYRYALLDTLLGDKLHHWDAEVRSLAALGMAAIVPTHPQHFVDEVLPWLVPRTQAPDLFVRHGAMMALAECVLALSAVPFELPPALRTAIRNVVPRAEKARAYRGRGGQMVRAAACRLIEVQCLAGHPMTERAGLRLLSTAEECLRHPHEDIQQAATAAWSGLLRTVLRPWLRADVAGIVQGEGGVTRLRGLLGGKIAKGTASAHPVLTATLLQPLYSLTKDENPAVRRGMALALGGTPRQVFVGAPATASQTKRLQPAEQAAADSGMAVVLEVTLQKLRAACVPERIPTRRDAEARRNAAAALGTLVVHLGVAQKQHGAWGVTPVQLRAVLRTLLFCTRDYATDTRGDVGSWVRRAAVRALQQVTLLALGAGAAAAAGLPTFACVIPNATPLAKVTLSDAKSTPPQRSDAPSADTGAGGAAAGESAPGDGEPEHAEAMDTDELTDASLLDVRTEVAVLPDGTQVNTPYGPGVTVAPLAAGAAYEVAFTNSAAFPYGSGTVLARYVTPVRAAEAIQPSLSTAALQLKDLEAVLCALLRLLGEKLDVVRAAAGSALASLLHSAPLAQATEGQVPAIGTLKSLFPLPSLSADSSDVLGTRSVNYSLPHHTFPRVVGMLCESAYAPHVMQGLCLSVGGLSESVVKHSAAALRTWAGERQRAGDAATLGHVATTLLYMLRGDRAKDADSKKQCEQAAQDREAAPSKVSLDEPLLEDAAPPLDPISDVLPASECIGVGYKVSVKTVIPVLRTLDVLLGTGALSLLHKQGHPFALHAVPLLRYRVMRSKDVRRVMAAGGVVLGLAALPAPVGPAAIVTALDLLGHPFPKVRQTVAERLYHVALSGVDFPWAPKGSSDAAATLLMSTPWNAEWRDVVPARDALYAVFGEDIPEKRMGAVAPDGSQWGGFAGKGDLEVQAHEEGAAAASDENASYLALVKDAGY